MPRIDYHLGMFLILSDANKYSFDIKAQEDIYLKYHVSRQDAINMIMHLECNDALRLDIDDD